MELTFRGRFSDERLEALARALVRRFTLAASHDVKRQERFDTTDMQGVEIPACDTVSLIADEIGLRLEHDRLHRNLTLAVRVKTDDEVAVRTLAFDTLWSATLDEGDALLAWQQLSMTEAWATGAMGIDRELLDGTTPLGCDALARVATAHPERLGVVFAHGVCIAQRGDRDGALAIFDVIVASEPQFYAARLAAVWLVQERGDHDESLTRLDAFGPFERHHYWHRARFESEWALERWTAALDTVDSWLRLSAGVEGFPLFDREGEVLRAALFGRLGDGESAATARERAGDVMVRIAQGDDLGRRDAWLARFVRGSVSGPSE